MALTAIERKRRWRERRRAMLQAPSVVAKVADPGVPDSALDPYELAVREVRRAVIRDLGGDQRMTATKAMQVDALVSRWIVAQMLDHDVHRLARGGRLLNLRAGRATPLLIDWCRVMDGYERALREVGLERIEGADEQARQLADLDRRLAAQRPQEQTGPGTGPVVAPEGRVATPGAGDVTTGPDRQASEADPEVGEF